MLQENFKYYKFIDWNTDFILKLFSKNTHFSKNYSEFCKDYLNKLVKWYKENPYPPQLTPSKTTVLLKKKSVVYTTTLNQNIVNNFILRNTTLSQEKIAKICEIIKSTNIIIKIIETTKSNNFEEYDSDNNLVDFKFCLKDKVKHDGIEGYVINVLDEMINIEYNKEQIHGTKKPTTIWVETDNKSLKLVELEIGGMDIEPSSN